MVVGLTFADVIPTPGALALFGAGGLLEVAPAAGGETVYVPFTGEAVPEVDIAGGRLVIAPLADDAVDEETAG